MKGTYANEIHLLLITVSKHLYIGKDGLLKYQDKPFSVDIMNFNKSKKEHLVYYIMQDSYSGNFLYKTVTTKTLIPLADFLYYSWQGEKLEDKYLWGMPENISVPKNLSSPELLEALSSLEVKPFHPTSGFASGIRIVRDLEDNLNMLLNRSSEHTLAGIERNKSKKIYSYMLNLRHDNNKVDKWQESNEPIKPKEYKEFIKHFPIIEEAKTRLKLTSDSDEEAWLKLTEIGEYSFPIPQGKFLAEKYDKADDIVFDAWEEYYNWKQIDKAWRALKVSPYCTDAYNLLAENSDMLEERVELYRRGLEAGRVSLGEGFLEENRGHFWLMVETRPYMRSLSGLAVCLWEEGNKDKAIELYYELLSLNPGDNQGIRYILINRLLEEGLHDKAKKLLLEHKEGTSFMAYSKALLLFRLKGSGLEANTALIEAYRSNPHVPLYLTGVKFLPYKDPAYYGWGDEAEAIIYAKDALSAWRKTPGAVDWLKETKFK